MQAASERHSPVSSATKRARLVFAHAEMERRLFFADGQALGVLEGEPFVWLERRLATSFIDDLRALRPEVLVTGWSTPASLAKELAAPDCPVRYVCHCAGSVRRLVPRGFIERGGIVSNWGPLAAAPVAEHALLLALAALRNLPAWRPQIERPDGRWPVEAIGTHSLFGRAVGVHGFGAVARRLVELLKPFGVQIQAYSPGVAPQAFEAAGVRRAESLGALFQASEVLFECEALTRESAGGVTAEILAALPDGAVFVNVGRGGVVEETALLREASSGRLRLALDVLRDEPATAASPFYAQANVILSPHIAGPTLDEYPQIGELALSNVRRFLRGQPLVAQVTLEIYDRST